MEKETLSLTQWEELLRKETESDIIRRDGYPVWIENKIFTESFLHGGEVTICFTNCIFEDKASLSNYNPSADIFISECIFKKGLYLGDIDSEHKISFLNCSLSESTVLSNMKIPRLELNLRYAQKIVFDSSSTYDYIQIGGMEKNKIENLHLNAGITSKRLEINHAEIKHLHIGYSTLESEMIVANSDISSLTFDNFRNEGVLKFLNCKAIIDSQSEVLINQSNMGKTEFFKFNFSSFSSINITNSVILECIFINCLWSNHKMVSKVVHFTSALETSDELDKRVLAENVKDVYKQIKYAFSKQGDYIQEQYFHGLEMNKYYKSLALKTDFWTKIILRLSFWTSNFGQSFLRPILSITIVNSILFYALFCLGATKFNSYNIFNFSNYPDTFASLLNLMNPLHKNNPELAGGPFIIDTFSRIFSSYFIYNIIRATRRFVK